jgi:hypothetical protein
MDVSFLDHCYQRLLRHPPRFQEAWERAALAQFRDAQFDRPRTGFPIAVALSMTMVDPIDAAFAVAGTSVALNLQLHQSLRRKAAQQIGIRTLLQKRPEDSSSRRSSSGPLFGGSGQTKPTDGVR